MFSFERLEIKEVILIKPKIYNDSRGLFFESYKFSEFEKNGVPNKFVQENQSTSKLNTVRALHYQIEPKAQGKLVRAIKGSVFDVAVDIRKESPTYGKWVGAILSEENKALLWVPPGFAHGFQALEEGAQILYKTTDEYSPEHEGGIIWNDPDINIDWKNKENITVSERDAKFPNLKDCKNNFRYT